MSDDGDKKIDMADIFGDSDSDDDGAAAPDLGADGGEDAEQVLAELADSDDDGAGAAGAGAGAAPRAAAPPIEFDAPYEPNPSADEPGGGDLSLARLTNVIAFEENPFDADTFEKEEEVVIDPETGAQRMRLRSTNVVRWRVKPGEKPGEKPSIESNARMVRWSDGTTQLLVGDEAFNVTTNSIVGEHNHLFLRTATVLTARTPLDSKLTIAPAGLNTVSHRRLAAELDKRHNKGSRVMTMATFKDPELEKAEREKRRADEIRDKERLELDQENLMQRAARRGRDVAGHFDEYDYDMEEDDADGAGVKAEEGPPMTDEERERRAMQAKSGAAEVTRKRAAAAEELDELEEDDAGEAGGAAGGPVDSLSDDSDGDPLADADDAQGGGAKKRRRAVAISDDDE